MRLGKDKPIYLLYALFVEPPMLHFVKSTGFLQPGQVCGLLNSSEKISISLPHSGHLHSTDDRFLNCSHPGQLFGVLISFLLWC